MSARLDQRFADLKRQGRAGLVAYVMAYDPDLETSFEVLRGLPAAGADVIELGFPFTDPMADGPSVQRAGERALKAGATLKGVLALVARFRKEDQTTPIVLMGYSNPIYHLGEAAFARIAGEAGIDGAIIVDAPPEEDRTIREALAANNISLIRLATPTTHDARLKTVLQDVSGFLYYVSVTGVTGVKATPLDEARAAIQRLKRATALPVALGFGVRTSEQARAMAQVADAVVVGSAFVDEIIKGEANAAPARVHAKVRELADAVRHARELEGTA